MLDQRRRVWANVVQMLEKCFEEEEEEEVFIQP